MSDNKKIAEHYGITPEEYKYIKSSITRILAIIQKEEKITQKEVYDLIGSFSDNKRQAIMITSAVVTLSNHF